MEAETPISLPTDADYDDPYEITDSYEVSESPSIKNQVHKDWKNQIKQKEKLAVILSVVCVVLLLLVSITVLTVSFWLIGNSSDETGASKYKRIADEIVKRSKEDSAMFFDLLTEFTDLFPARICRFVCTVSNLI